MPGPFAPFFGGIDPLRCAMESPAGIAFLERKSAFWFVAALTIVLFASCAVENRRVRAGGAV
jgi:hypothetical protein